MSLSAVWSDPQTLAMTEVSSSSGTNRTDSTRAVLVGSPQRNTASLPSRPSFSQSINTIKPDAVEGSRSVSGSDHSH
jgi:hypothetical protein